MIKNLLALIGILYLALTAWIGVSVYGFYDQARALDGQALDVYRELGEQVLRTGNAAEATVWKVKVQDGLSPEEVEETMRFVANEHNIRNVGELPLYKQVEAMQGEPYRFAKIYMFCNALTAARMMDYNDAYSAYLPCRLSLVEDPSGQLWIYTLNMDLMIHGGRPLPPALKEEALQVKATMLDIMKRGSTGEF